MDFESPRLVHLGNLVNSGHVAVYITDIVRSEVENALSSAIEEAIAILRPKKMKRKLGVLARSESAAVPGATRKMDRSSIITEQAASFQKLLTSLRAELISSDDVPVSELRDRYFRSIPPFEASDAKKSEFPDAITVLAADSYARNQGIRLYLVTADQGLGAAASAADSLEHVETLSAMIARIVESVYSLRSSAAESALQHLRNEAAEMIRERFIECGFYVEDEWESEVEDVVVTDVALNEPAISAIKENAADFEFVATIEFSANVKVADPSMTAYDSETGETYVYNYLYDTLERRDDFDGIISIVFNVDDPVESRVADISFHQADIGLEFEWDSP